MSIRSVMDHENYDTIFRHETHECTCHKEGHPEVEVERDAEGRIVRTCCSRCKEVILERKEDE